MAIEPEIRAAIVASPDPPRSEYRRGNRRHQKPASAALSDRAGERGRDHPGRDGETELSRCRAGATTGSRPGRESDTARHASRRAAGRRLDHGPTNVGTRPSGDRATYVFAKRQRRVPWESTRPTVGVRRRSVFPVLSTRPDVGGPHSDSTDVPETDSTFDSDLLAPERIQASSVYRRQDAARFPGMDSALRMALNSGPGGKTRLARYCAATEGLLTGSKLANHNKTGETTHAQYLSQFCFGRVDGRFAAEQSDIQGADGKLDRMRTRAAPTRRTPHRERPGCADGEGPRSRDRRPCASRELPRSRTT